MSLLPRMWLLGRGCYLVIAVTKSNQQRNGNGVRRAWWHAFHREVSPDGPRSRRGESLGWARSQYLRRAPVMELPRSPMDRGRPAVLAVNFLTETVIHSEAAK